MNVQPIEVVGNDRRGVTEWHDIIAMTGIRFEGERMHDILSHVTFGKCKIDEEDLKQLQSFVNSIAEWAYEEGVVDAELGLARREEISYPIRALQNYEKYKQDWDQSQGTAKPIRVHRKRVKGWRMPDNTVSVCRPGKFGNPFWGSFFRHSMYAGKVSDREEYAVNVEQFRNWLVTGKKLSAFSMEESEKKRKAIIDGLESLRGKNLACYCGLDFPCHADVLLQVANEPEKWSLA